MRSSEVRDKFLGFFRKRGHAVLPSSPVVPHGDKTLLFTNAGMVQFKDIFTGRQPAPQPPRATTVQKCIRAGGKHNDLDNVGYTKRHLTFFEMLGNFSFGDYFKKEAIEFAWELVTGDLGIDPDRLWVTVFREDDEAAGLWRRIARIDEKRIVRLGEKDNFWSMGDVGPCGPCSEILVDRGEAFGPRDIENGERFFEIWNLVFMQFEQAPGGARSALPRPSIDTGMGLERVAMVLQDVDSVYDTDILRSLIRRIEEISGLAYDPGPEGVAHRVLADHIRSLVFALADGAEISNEGRGYVVRRILRRAARYGRKIHATGPILFELVETLTQEMGRAYPEIASAQSSITRQIRMEEERFGETLDRGIALFDELAAKLKRSGERLVPGADVFRLYDTFGFPTDLVERMAEEAGLGVDREGFESHMAEQKERSRVSSTFTVLARSDRDTAQRLVSLPPTRFVGYHQLAGESELQAAFEHEGGLWSVVLESTPFYAEGGGQVGDRGLIEGDGYRLRVEDTKKEQGRFLHLGRLEEDGSRAPVPGSAARAAVDRERREAIQRNHSATHLLHAALRRVLGTHVHQKGSLVDDARLRFDISHFAAVSPAELEQSAELVREAILTDLPVEENEMDRDEAIASGAMAFFGEKYGDRVRVVRMGDFSIELCGGTHVARTGEIGSFLVVHEGSVSSGVRRLEALTAGAVERIHRDNEKLIAELARRLKTKPDALLEKIDRLLEENRELKSKSKTKVESGASTGIARERIGDILFVSGVWDGAEAAELRAVYDSVKNESPRLICAFLARRDGKVQALLTVSPELEKEGWQAQKIFQAGAEHIAARGGGRPAMVQAGGTRPEGAESAIAAFAQSIRSGR